jgi:hypothetical protein
MKTAILRVLQRLLWLAPLLVVAGGLLWYFDPFGLFVPRVSGQIVPPSNAQFLPGDAVRVSFVRIDQRTVPAFGRDVVAAVEGGTANFAVRLPPGRYKVQISVDPSTRAAGNDPLWSLLWLIRESRTPITLEIDGSREQRVTIDLAKAVREASRNPGKGQ